MNNELRYQLAICLIPNVGPITAKKLIAYCGGAEAVFREKKKNLLKIPHVGELTAKSVGDEEIFEKVDRELEFIAKYKIKTRFYLNSDYPVRLKPVEDSPVMLFSKGHCDLDNVRAIGVVGTRSITGYGKDMCCEIVKDLADINPVIISGLAYGIDTVAHKTALDNDLKTAAVLGHGLDRIYPSLNRSLAEKITQSGILITDFFSNTKPDRENFPRRNRIIAGLCDAVIVIEAAEKGGALITAYYANDYNRDVFAVPGKKTDNFSRGCNHLIKTNKAHLAESADDIKYIMNWTKSIKPKPVQRIMFAELSGEQQKIVNILKENQPVSLDSIVALSKMTFSKATATLLELELKSVVKTLPGNFYKIID